MRRFVLAGLLAVVTSTSLLQPVWAGDRFASYRGHPYPVQPSAPHPQPAPSEGRPILKKLIVGGLLVGAGFLAGRLTAPRPQPYYSGYAPTHRHGNYAGHHPSHPHRGW